MLFLMLFASPQNFNPLPPHGGRLYDYCPHCGKKVFQSTPSAWRETFFLRSCFHLSFHFNPLPPHGGRPADSVATVYQQTFQSTPSAWRETRTHAREAFHTDISIHSLRMEGDAVVQTCGYTPSDFNPLPPHGGRLEVQLIQDARQRISIHSLRMEGDPCVHLRHYLGTDISIHSLRMEGDELADPVHQAHRISIHSLRMEGDNSTGFPMLIFRYFNPLPPHGGRQFLDDREVREHGISIHSLRMEGDQRTSIWIRVDVNFNPLPPHGGRHVRRCSSYCRM